MKSETKKQPVNPVYNKDGWSNLLTGYGTRNDKTRGNFMASELIPDNELGILYDGDGLVASVIDTVAEDMIKKGWEITGDEDGKFFKKMQQLRFTHALSKALKYSRLYGGALIIIKSKGTDVRLERAINRDVYELEVVGINDVLLTAKDFENNVASEMFGKPITYTIRKKFGDQYQIHATNVIEVFGKQIENRNAPLVNRYFGASILNECNEGVGTLGIFLKTVGNIVQEYGVNKYKLHNLEELVALGDYASLEKRMENMNLSKSVINAILLGPNEEHTVSSPNVSGMKDLIEIAMHLVSAKTHIPQTKLFGRSPAGMDATGQSDLENYYSMIGNLQSTILEPVLQRMMDILAPNGWSREITFNALWQESEKEIVERREKQANIDKLYIEMGVLTPEEVRNSRFEGGYSHDYILGSTGFGGAPLDEE